EGPLAAVELVGPLPRGVLQGPLVPLGLLRPHPLALPDLPLVVLVLPPPHPGDEHPEQRRGDGKEGELAAPPPLLLAGLVLLGLGPCLGLLLGLLAGLGQDP